MSVFAGWSNLLVIEFLGPLFKVALKSFDASIVISFYICY